jgi:protein-S-isoprenylcysteine O-methyltransferase Ste14
MALSTYVDANYRFIAAYQEVNARIAQRQQALMLYTTLVVSLLAALVALQSATQSSSLPVEWLSFGFPVASVCLVLLNFKTERAITHLRRFLSSLEQLQNAHESLPSYNTDPRWAEGANSARNFQDWAAAVLVCGGNGLGLGAVFSIYPERVAQDPVIPWLTVGLTVVSVVALLMIPRWSYRSADR